MYFIFLGMGLNGVSSCLNSSLKSVPRIVYLTPNAVVAS